MSFRDLLNAEFEHQRKTVTQDQYGDPIETWVTLGTIRGRLRTASVQERTAAALVAQVVEYVVYLSPEADVQRGDRLVHPEATVEVTFVRNPSLAGHHLEAEGKAVIL